MTIDRRSLTVFAAALMACSGASSSEVIEESGADASADSSPSSDATVSGEDGSSDAGADDASTSAALPPGPYTIVYAGTEVGIDTRTTTETTFTSTGLTMYKAMDDERPEIGTNTNQQVFSDGKMMIGRWAGGKTGGKFYNIDGTGLFTIPANGGFHYVIGVGADSLPSTGKANYTLAHTTSVTQSDGTVMPGTLTGSLAANFAGATTAIGFNLALQIGGANYTLQTAGGSADPTSSGAPVNTMPKGAFYTNITNMTGPVCGDSAGSCTAAINGVVGGANGDRIGLVLHIFKGAGGSATSLSAGAVFEKQ